MELENASRTRMRATASPNGRLWHPEPQESSKNDADRGGMAAGARPSSIRADRRSLHPEAMPAQRVVIGKSSIAPKPSGLVIEIFGVSAGVLVMDGTRFVFRATHRAFRELDESRVGGAADTERAVYSCWTRFQHRSRSGIRSDDRSR